MIPILILSSCAYFNTLYNARRLYAEAEERRENDGSERELRDRYGEVVEKCAKVVREYPDSKWVDDALFLMGKALVRQGELDKGIRKFIEITTNFPESDYVPPSLYWLGLGYMQRGEYNQALAQIERFLESYPDHDLTYEVMFLAGDIKREMGLEEEALALYAQVAEEASDRDVIDDATKRTAELFFAQEDYARAAEAYEALIRKGIPWGSRYELTRSLGDCYSRIGRCDEALDLFDQLLEESVTTKEKPPIMLGRAKSYVCMDSLSSALSIYNDVTREFPKSKYSAEAFYHMGIIYHESLDSLQNAQAAFSKVASEYANSEFANESIQKGSSIKRLLELESRAGGVVTSEQLAEKKFLAAEIQLTRLGEVDLALENYEAIVDSFPESSYAPRAAYAVAWIYQTEKGDRDRAVESYRRVIDRFPRSVQARGAVDRIGTLGALELERQMRAFVDSTAAQAEIEARADSARADTAAALPGAVLRSAPDSVLAVPVADSTSAAPSVPDSASSDDPQAAPLPAKSGADSSLVPGDAAPAPADTTGGDDGESREGGQFTICCIIWQ